MKKAPLLILTALTGCLLNAADKPNIIFIFADDWGYGDISLHGTDWIDMPHLDQMAAEGIDFQNFTVNSPVCSPSRVAVMTGKFPARFCIHQHFAGIGANAKRGMPDWLDPTVPLLPKLLKDAGYKTGHFGKWHIGRAPDAPTEDMYGYDEYATFNGSDTKPLSAEGLESVDHAEAFIKANKEHAFFINLWLHEAHLPHYPLEKYMEKFKHLDEQKRVYASIIAEGDEGVGRILSLIKELGLDDKTLIVFSTDNGPEAERGKEHLFHNNNKRGLGGYYSVGTTAGLRGQKRSLYAGGIRVPFIVRWPGVVPAGNVDRESVLTAVDLLPTFLEVAGVPMPDGYQPDGQSAFGAFKGNPLKRSKPIFWEWRGGLSKDYTWPSLGIRDGKWKMLVNREMGKLELYNIDRDWAEERDLSDKYPEIVEQLSRKLETWKLSLPKEPEQAVTSRERNR